MADLNAFFAKKDRRKRRSKVKTPTSTSADAQGGSKAVGGDVKEAVDMVAKVGVERQEGSLTEQKMDGDKSISAIARGDEGEIRVQSSEGESKRKDDGWIDFEEESGAKVHTGGRTIVSMTRDGEKNAESETIDVDEMTEKFSGWQQQKPPEEDPGSGSEAAEEEAVDESKFPSLAETKHAPQIPLSAGIPGATGRASVGRAPRVKLTGIDKLKEKLAQRNAETTTKTPQPPVPTATTTTSSNTTAPLTTRDIVATDTEKPGASSIANSVIETAATTNSAAPTSPTPVFSTSPQTMVATTTTTTTTITATTSPRDALQKPHNATPSGNGVSETPKEKAKPLSSLERKLQERRSGASSQGQKRFPGLKGLLKKRTEGNAS